MSQYKTGQVHWLRGAIKGPACLAGNSSAHESVFRRHQGVFQGGKVTRYCLITFFFFILSGRLAVVLFMLSNAEAAVHDQFLSQLGGDCWAEISPQTPRCWTTHSPLCTVHAILTWGFSLSVLCVIWLGRDLARHFMKHYEEALLDCTQIAQCWVCAWVCRVQGPRSEI